MSAPRVSVILPVYNGAPYVAQAIQSVLDQTFRDLELIVVNDGSTDATGDIIAGFHDERLRIFQQENRGVSSARNKGLLEMRGQFLCFVDADDTLPADSIGMRLKVFDADPNVSSVDGYVKVIDESMNEVSKTWMPGCRGKVMNELLLLREDCFFALTWMIRVQKPWVHTFDERITHTEDLLFLLAVSSAGNHDYVKDHVYCYRKRSNSAMTNINGLARGYSHFYREVCRIYEERMTPAMRLRLALRIRRIIFLCYIRRLQPVTAVRYLVFGKID